MPQYWKRLQSPSEVNLEGARQWLMMIPRPTLFVQIFLIC